MRSTLKGRGKCATYDLDSEKNQLTKVEVTSPMDIVVLLHDKNQLNIHRELSAYLELKGILLDCFM